MGGFDWERAGLGLATGGISELERAGVGPSAALGGGGGGGKNGLGGKGSGAPSSPDFTAAANAQAAASQANTREQTAANRPNQSGPFGSSTWSQGADGQWTQNTSLAPGLQAGADSLMGQIANQGPAMTGDQARDQAITSAYGQAASRLDPQWAQREESTRAQLANQGLDAGSQAYDSQMGNLGRERNDAYSSAMANAIGQGTAAGHVAFADNQSAQMQPYQQLGLMQGLSAQPGFTAAGSGQTPQLLNAASLGYQGALNQYGANQAGKNSTMSGAASLAPLLFL
jgi:hypothetical protein